MTSSVSAKILSAVDARPHPRGGKQGNANDFHATLDRMPAKEAPAPAHAGQAPASVPGAEGFSRPMVGLEQQVIRLTVSAEAPRQEAPAGKPAPDMDRSSGEKGRPLGLLRPLHDAANPVARTKAAQVLDTRLGADEAAAGEPVAMGGASDMLLSDEAVDEAAADQLPGDPQESASRDGPSAVAQLAEALMLPPREVARNSARAEGERADSRDQRAAHGAAGTNEDAGVAHRSAAAERSGTTDPKSPVRQKPGQAAASIESPAARLQSEHSERLDAKPQPLENRSAVAVAASAPAVEARDLASAANRAAPSARDAEAMNKADTITVSHRQEESPVGEHHVRQPAASRSDAGQSARPEVPTRPMFGDRAGVTTQVGQTSQQAAAARAELARPAQAGNRETAAGVMPKAADPAVAQAGAMAQPAAASRPEAGKPARAGNAETKAQPGVLHASTSATPHHAAADITNSHAPEQRAVRERDTLDMPARDRTPVEDEPDSRAAGEGGSRDTARGVTAPPGPAIAPAPTSANPAALSTPAAAVLEAIRSQATWTAHLSGSKTGAPGELKSLKINLTPVELGSVTAHLSIEDDSVSVELTAETGEARSRLAADTDTIVKSLRAIGLEVDRITVQLAPRADAPAQSDTGAGARQQGFAADSGAGDARGQSSGSQQGRNTSLGEEATVRTDMAPTPNRNASSRYI